MALDFPKLHPTPAAARLLGLKTQTLETWRCSHRYALPYVKIGRKVYYREADLLAFIERRIEGGETPQL